MIESITDITSLQFVGALPEQSPQVNAEFCVNSLIDFIGDFRSRAMTAQNRVWLQSMYVLPSHGTNLLIDAFTQADSETDKRLQVDGLQGFLELRHLGGDKFQKNGFYTALAHMHESLIDAGVTNKVTKPLPHWKYPIFPKGRNHIKIGVIDDVAWVGCSNFGRDTDFNRHDYMIRITRPRLVEAVADLFVNQPDHNYAIQDGDTSLLVDAGKVGESLIWDEALAIVNKPDMTDFRIMTPWIPDSALLDALYKRYSEGCNVQILTWDHPVSGHVEDIYSAIKKWNRLKMQLRGKNLQNLFTQSEMHSKLLIATGPTSSIGLALLTILHIEELN